MGRKGEIRPTTRQWMMVMEMSRSHRGLTWQELGALIQAGRSTVFRDLRAIEASGVVVISERLDRRETRHRVEKSDLPKLVLSDEEVQAIEVARSRIEHLRGLRLIDTYDRLLVRLGRPIPREPGSETARRDIALRRVVDDALHRRRRLRFWYTKLGESRPALRTVDPIGWRLKDGVLYLEALDGGADARRTFASSRMRDPEVLDEEALAYEEAKFEVIQVFEDLPRFHVVARVAPGSAARLGEHPLCDDQQLALQEDGDTEVSGVVAGLVAAADWVQYWGPDAHAVEPEELVAEMISRLERALGRYRK
jgi:predicted DNA-binding transcriptional regulator YafY